MFSTKTALAGFVLIGTIAQASAQTPAPVSAVGPASGDKHLSLDDIDGLARQKIVDSLTKAPAQAPATGLNAPLSGPAPAAPVAVVQPAAPKETRKAAAPRAVPVSFIGAYSDMSGAYILYDFQGAIYTAKAGSKLLNGWTVSRVDGFVVTVSEGKRSWTEVISAPVQMAAAVGDSPALQAVRDLSGPLPPAGSIGGSPVTTVFGH